MTIDAIFGMLRAVMGGQGISDRPFFMLLHGFNHYNIVEQANDQIRRDQVSSAFWAVPVEDMYEDCL